MMVDGERRWVEFEMMELETDDFVALGRAFEDETGCDESTTVGDATMRVMPQRDLVDFAVDWMTENRP